MLPLKYRLALVISCLLTACSKAPPPAKPAATANAAQSVPSASGVGQISWFQGDVSAAFAEAKRTNTPVFLYWGAVWCPYCNQVKATLFNRADFAERAKHFIPVELDGDSPEAQKLAADFKVRGYPTMILFRPDGTEITRLPGEVDAQRYLQVLALGMAAERPVKETLNLALRGEPLKPDDWRLLAYYAFDADEEQLIAKAALPTTLAELAGRCPPTEPEVATRLALKALLAQAEAQTKAKLGGDAAAQLVDKVLSDPLEVRSHFDLLIAAPDKLLNLVTTEGESRKALAAKWDHALEVLARDKSLSTTDRFAATGARVTLARQNGPLPATLVETLKTQLAEADRATINVFERVSVIYTAAGVLTDAGYLDDSDALLNAELKISRAPYYFMRMLGSNAKLRGNKGGALRWYEEAWNAAEGGATRLQWGGGFVSGLLELAPNDDARIEAATIKLFDQASRTPNPFYERNRAVLERTGKKLVEWNASGKHGASFKRISAKAQSLCQSLPKDDAQRAACEGMLHSSHKT